MPNFIKLTNAVGGNPLLLELMEIRSVTIDEEGKTRVYTFNLAYYYVEESMDDIIDLLKAAGSEVIDKC